MGPAEKRTALAQVALLRGLAPAALDALAGQCEWRRFRPNQAVIDQDSPTGDVFFVAAGRVRVTIYAQSGREIAFRDLGEGASFGELSAIDGEARSASVVALTSAWLARLSRQRFWALLRANPPAVENLLRSLTVLVRSLTERVVDYSTLGVQNRIQAELIRMARASGVTRNRATIAPLPRHADIASRVSTNREAVARELSRLARLGLVERRPGALVVADVARLAQMVERVRGG
jgi:CRP-like cAMP-binding protein